MVHSGVYLNKYVVSIAPFSTPACPIALKIFIKLLFLHVFAIYFFHPFFIHFIPAVVVGTERQQASRGGDANRQRAETTSRILR